MVKKNTPSEHAPCLSLIGTRLAGGRVGGDTRASRPAAL